MTFFWGLWLGSSLTSLAAIAIQSRRIANALTVIADHMRNAR